MVLQGERRMRSESRPRVGITVLSRREEKKIGIVGRMKGKNVGFRVLGEKYKEGGSRDEGEEKVMCVQQKYS